MSDETSNVIELGQRIGTKENPLGVSKTGKPLTGTAGRKISPEQREKMNLGRERAIAEGRSGRPRKHFTRREVEEHTIEALKPQALKRLENILYDEDASHAQIVAAAKLVLEHSIGKPMQRVQVDQVQRIEYLLAAHEPAPLQLAE